MNGNPREVNPDIANRCVRWIRDNSELRNPETLPFLLCKVNLKVVKERHRVASVLFNRAAVLPRVRAQREETKIHCLRNYEPLRAC